MAETAVIILNFNGSNYLKQFLPGVIEHSNDCEIWVADNASRDDSVETLKTKFPEVKTLLLDRNYGFCGGYNRAIQQIDAKYYILLNSDIEVTRDWTKPLIHILKSNRHIAAVQPKILSFHNRDYFEYAGAAGGMIDKYGYPFCRGRIFDQLEKDEGQYNDEIEIFWATGACMAITGDVFKSSGGLDEYFFAHMEEIDLCWRLKNQGYSIKYSPNSVIYHVGGGTLPKENPKKIYLNFRNSLLVLLKNLPSNQLLPKIFIRLLLDFPAAVSFIFKGNIRSALMILKAHLDFYYVALSYLKKRQDLRLKPENMPGFYDKSIVFKYFFTGVRKASNL